jgi:hypothetical protein
MLAPVNGCKRMFAVAGLTPEQKPAEIGSVIEAIFLRCICLLMMLWTAPPPARECHEVGAS